MEIRPGDTFLTTAASQPHLWVVLSDPEIDTMCVVIVNLTSGSNQKDTTCILQPGDHPFIRYETEVFYGRAQERSLSLLQISCEAGHMVQKESFEAIHLKRIQLGALESKHTPRGVKRLLEGQRSHLGF